jgi:hypothetical protein
MPEDARVIRKHISKQVPRQNREIAFGLTASRSDYKENNQNEDYEDAEILPSRLCLLVFHIESFASKPVPLKLILSKLPLALSKPQPDPCQAKLTEEPNPSQQEDQESVISQYISPSRIGC